jgi:hypothetical protein
MTCGRMTNLSASEGMDEFWGCNRQALENCVIRYQKEQPEQFLCL